MKDKFNVSVLIFIVAIFHLYLVFFCHWLFLILVVIFGALAISVHRQYHWAKLVSIVLLIVQVLLNIITVAFVYNSGDPNVSDIIGTIGREIRFVLESVPVTLISLIAIYLLATRYKTSA